VEKAQKQPLSVFWSNKPLFEKNNDPGCSAFWLLTFFARPIESFFFLRQILNFHHHQKVGGSGLAGGSANGRKKRQGLVDNFQKGLSPVFVCLAGSA